MFYEFTSTATVRDALEAIGDQIEHTLASDAADRQGCLEDIDARLSELLGRIEVGEDA